MSRERGEVKGWKWSTPLGEEEVGEGGEEEEEGEQVGEGQTIRRDARSLQECLDVSSL